MSAPYNDPRLERMLTRLNFPAIRRRLLEQKPSSVPIILIRGTIETPDTKRRKFLADEHCTGRSLRQSIMRVVELSPSDGIMLYTWSGGKLREIDQRELMTVLYEKRKNPTTEFLHVVYSVIPMYG